MYVEVNKHILQSLLFAVGMVCHIQEHILSVAHSNDVLYAFGYFDTIHKKVIFYAI